MRQILFHSFFSCFLISFNRVMYMIRKVINYVKEDGFEIRIDPQYVCIINYSNISYMEEEKISVSYPGGAVLIKGKHLVVVKLLEQEVLIKGKFSALEFRRDHE